MKSWLMTIPNEVFLHIMGYLKFVEVKKLTHTQDEFHFMLKKLNPSLFEIPRKISDGIYYNLSYECFDCGISLDDVYILNMCLPSSSIYVQCNDSYPMISEDCIHHKKLKTGEQVSIFCKICNKDAIHLCVSSYHNYIQ